MLRACVDVAKLFWKPEWSNYISKLWRDRCGFPAIPAFFFYVGSVVIVVYCILIYLWMCVGIVSCILIRSVKLDFIMSSCVRLCTHCIRTPVLCSDRGNFQRIAGREWIGLCSPREKLLWPFVRFFSVSGNEKFVVTFLQRSRVVQKIVLRVGNVMLLCPPAGMEWRFSFRSPFWRPWLWGFCRGLSSRDLIRGIGDWILTNVVPWPHPKVVATEGGYHRRTVIRCHGGPKVEGLTFLNARSPISMSVLFHDPRTPFNPRFSLRDRVSFMSRRRCSLLTNAMGTRFPREKQFAIQTAAIFVQRHSGPIRW